MRIIVDGHCDTISEVLDRKIELRKNDLHIDLHRMKCVGSHVQFFAAFIHAKKITVSPMIRAMQIIDRLYSEVEKNNDCIEIAYSHGDVEKILGKGKNAAIISIEGGEALEGNISSLRMLYKLGVRCIGLTWNYKNEIASGIGEESDEGLSDFGIEVVKEMNELGMIVDVSHLSEKGFWEVLEQSSKPIIASHSNCRSICGHKRNLTDEQIVALAKNSGVMGMNFYPSFLNNTGKASLDDVLNHIEHISALAGVDYIGLGSDFDGIEETPAGLEDITKIDELLNELSKRNYSDEDINKIAGGNLLRVIKLVVG